MDSDFTLGTACLGLYGMSTVDYKIEQYLIDLVGYAGHKRNFIKEGFNIGTETVFVAAHIQCVKNPFVDIRQNLFIDSVLVREASHSLDNFFYPVDPFL